MRPPSRSVPRTEAAASCDGNGGKEINMNLIRNFVVLLVASALAAFAMPASAAPAKTYSVSATSPLGPGATAVTLVITNVTPSGGNSSINSIVIAKPTGWQFDQPISSIGSSSLTVDASGNLKVNNFSGLLPKNQQGIHAISITFTLTPTSTIGCSTGSINWASLLTVSTGNAFSGDFFTWDGVGGTSLVSATTCYSVTYNPNGSTNGAAPTDGTLYPNGATVTVKANTGGLVKTGYTFNGWNSLSSGLGTHYGATFTMGSQSVVLYAEWLINSYTVTFESNGGSAVPSQSVQYNTPASQPPTPTRDGYTFGGWYSNAGLTTAYNFATPVTGPLTLYAKWTIINYTVSFESNGGSAVNSQSVPYNGTASQPADPTRTGYGFAGWYSNSGLTTPYNFSTPVTGPVNLYAKWVINSYTVSFNTNGGSAVSSQAVPYNGTATQPADPTKTGYTFAGWYSDSALTTSFNFATPITANTTLYAKWTQNTLTMDVPSTATINEPFTVTVYFTPPGGGPVTLSSPDGCTLSVVPGATSDTSAAFTVTITAVPQGQTSCTIKAETSDLSYSATTQLINPVNTGVLGCGIPAGNNLGGGLSQYFSYNPPIAYIGDPDWGLQRAKKNKDGAGCNVAVPYIFEFDPVANTAAFIVPNTFGEKVAVEYVLLWSPIVTDAVPLSYPGLPFALANLAWIKNNSGAWVYVPALACVEDDVEAGLVTSGPQPVMPLIPNVEPFITLGATYPGYAPGEVALMCVAQEGWTSIGRNGSGQKIRQYWHKIIDYADGGARLSN